jgi:hypothetical protein
MPHGRSETAHYESDYNKRAELLVEERRWLDLIKDHELGIGITIE